MTLHRWVQLVLLVAAGTLTTACADQNTAMPATTGSPDPTPSFSAQSLPPTLPPALSSPPAASPTPTASDTADPTTVPGSESAPPVFASAQDLTLQPPAARVAGYAYHESLFDTAMPLVPQGRPKKIDNPTFVRPPNADGPRYIIMASRGRPTGPSTGVDIVLDPGEQVVAPVSGEVVDASQYELYCTTPDRRVIIKPDQAPERRVVIFHLDKVAVVEGQQVVAGQTLLGEPRIFNPHSAQYDSYVAGGRPHVHLEVEREPSRPLPGCPIKE